MIAALEFDPAARLAVTAALLALPVALRPTFYGLGEDELDRVVGDGHEILDIVGKKDVGFMFKNAVVTYDIGLAKSKNTRCDAYFENGSAEAEEFLVHMAGATPIFGYACEWDEYVARNKVFANLKEGSIESWVGRNTSRYVPGFYWWTLLSASFAEKHQVPLSSIERVALEHRVLDGDIHLFRFYDRPEDWRSASHVAELCASLPGVFHIGDIAPKVAAARDLAELRAITREWR